MNTFNERYIMQEINGNIVEAINLSGWDEDSQGKRWEDYDTILCPNGQIIDMVKLLKDQELAKAALAHMAPSFGGLITKLRFIYTFRIQTQATDGFNILVNPQFTFNMSLKEKCFVMAHELMHCILNHMRRGEGHDHMKSNIAADYEVNDTLTYGIGLFDPSIVKDLKGYIDKQYIDKGYEEIYASITQSANNSQNNQDQANQAAKNSQNNKSSKQSSGSNQSNNQPQNLSPDFKAGWAAAIEDWKKSHK